MRAAVTSSSPASPAAAAACFELGFVVAAEFDVGAATGHVGRDGDFAGHAGVLDDVRLALVLLGVQHLVRNAVFLEHAGQQFGSFDGRGAHEHGLLARHAILDVFDDGFELVALREIHEVRVVLADHRAMSRDHHHFEAIDLHELRRFGVGRAGHAGQLLVEAEVVLEGDRRDRLVLRANLHAFLRLDRLVQAIRPAAARHRAAGEFVDDDHFARAHDVFHVALVDRVRAQRRVQVMHEPDVLRVVETLAFAQQPGLGHEPFDGFVAGFGEMRLLLLFVDREIAGPFFLELLLEPRDQRVDLDVEVFVFFGGTRNDQRRARFVDEDRVDFVDDREHEAALHFVVEAEREIVAQVVEAEFVVGAVGDVAAIGGALLGRVLLVLDDADGEPQEAIDRTHPVRVALREVLVDGDDVHALTRERVEVGGQRRHQRLAFAGAHLGDAAIVAA